MPFAITQFRTFSRPSYEAVTAQFTQVAEFTITRAATDVQLDIGDVAGTFWTQAGAGVPTAIGPQALLHWRSIVQKSRNIVSVQAAQVFETKTKVTAAPATNQYRLTQATAPTLRVDLFSGDATPATITFVVEVSLSSGELPVKNFGV
jgi:hypothetical protein